MANPTTNRTRQVCAPADGKTATTDQAAPPTDDNAPKAERIAKRMARAGLCYRREAEAWIEAGRVRVNGKLLKTPAHTVTDRDCIDVDGKPLPQAEQPRVWRYHKPTGIVTTNHDPQGRPTIFDNLPKSLPRVITVGRLDLNSEGLLLLTNDGEIARKLELPSTGWQRKYRARVHGTVDQAKLSKLADGHEVSGIKYGPIQAVLERAQTGANAWVQVSLREGKNREVRKVLESIGLTVNRLIRISYGPFLLGNLPEGGVEELAPHVLADQLGIGERRSKEGHAVAKPRQKPKRKPKSPPKAARTNPKAPAEKSKRTPHQKPGKKPGTHAGHAKPQRGKTGRPSRRTS
ncbi:MAG: pseudouridine synthase [Pseudomonadota bacterium]